MTKSISDELDEILHYLRQASCQYHPKHHHLDERGELTGKECILPNPKVEETKQAILNLLEREVTKGKFQLKANIFTMFNVAMTQQEMSARPPKDARFRTPLEELAIILENQMPTDDLAQLKKGKE